MNTDIKNLKALSGFMLEVELADGRRGIFDVAPHLMHPGLSALRDDAYFRQVTVLLGAATWPDGEDIAPATLAAHLRVVQTA